MTSSLRQAEVLNRLLTSFFVYYKEISRNPDPPGRPYELAGGGDIRESDKLLRHPGDEELGREGQGCLCGGHRQREVQDTNQESAGGGHPVNRVTCALSK